MISKKSVWECVRWIPHIVHVGWSETDVILGTVSWHHDDREYCINKVQVWHRAVCVEVGPVTHSASWLVHTQRTHLFVTWASLSHCCSWPRVYFNTEPVHRQQRVQFMLSKLRRIKVFKYLDYICYTLEYVHGSPVWVNLWVLDFCLLGWCKNLVSLM